MNRIDTHLHLIEPSLFGYQWTDGLPALAKKTFSLADYWQAAESTGIESSIFLEVDVDEPHRHAEAQYVCKLSEDPIHRILGVVAAGRPERESFEEDLELMRHPNLLGIRRVLHTQSDDLSRSSVFRRNVSVLGSHGMTFDICAQARQLPVMMELVDACPGTQFILDHCGNPNVAGGVDRDWQRSVQELAKRGNVVCKVSGLIASADPLRVDVDAVRPFFEVVVAAFGWERLMFGGDWPVCLLTCDLRRWVSVVEGLVGQESEEKQFAFYRNNAIRVYQLGARVGAAIHP